MFKKLLPLLLLFPHALMGAFDYRVQNSNFTISQPSEFPHANKSYLYNYDRLRFLGDYSEDGFLFTLIGDAINYLGNGYVSSSSFEALQLQKSDTPFNTQTSFSEYQGGSAYAKLYRVYGGYEDGENRVILGLQNITMGVGRIWTPTNLFNPKNSYALESDEVFGVAALAYTRYLSETSHMMVVASQKSNNTFKYGARYKTFLEFADFAIDVVSSNDTKMLGYEVEGNLADTGIEIRSEGAYIKSNLQTTATNQNEREFYQAIIGADYGFVNGVTAVFEALYSSQKFSYEESLLNLDSEIFSNLTYTKLSTGVTLSYSLNLFLDASLLYIESFGDKNSRFISPNLTYTLNDFNSLTLGAMLYDGESSSEFAQSGNSYYFKWILSF